MTAGYQREEHVFDELPALLAGELSRADTGRVSDHLRSCDDCRQELVLAVSASAALRSARRFAPQAVLDPDDELPDPARFLAELASGGIGGGPLTDPRGLPPLQWPPGAGPDGSYDPRLDPGFGAPTGGMPAGPGQAGPGPAGPFVGGAPGRRPPRARHARQDGRQGRSRLRWTAAAAALLVVAGVGAGVVIGQRGDNRGGGRQVALSAVGPGDASGTATLRGGELCIDRTTLPAPVGGHSYEVWLVDSARSKLQAVGMTSNGQGCWTLPATKPGDGYNTIEISDEPDDGNAAYSGTSVLRGRYS